MSESPRLRVLGAISVLEGDTEKPLRGKAALLTANLVASYPLACSTSVLCDALWNRADDERTRRLLRAEVARLRRRLGEEIVFDDSGYRLIIDDHEIDVFVLSQQAEEARIKQQAGEWAAAMDVLDRALALVRGEPFANLTDRLSLEAFAVSTAEQVLTLEETAVGVLLEMGRNDVALVRATDLVANEPLRERRHAQLMTALDRTGRRAEALRHYQSYREMLANETGLEPGVELVALDRSIAQGTPAPGLEVTTPVTDAGPDARLGLRHPTTSLVGRGQELDQLGRALAESRLVTLTGPPGIGKTRLAQEYAIGTTDDVTWIDVTGESDDSILGALAQGSNAWSNDDVMASLISHFRLSTGSSLVVLDNCNTPTGDFLALVAELLARVPDLRVLVTSTTTLGAADEVVIHLRGLADDEAWRLLESKLGTKLALAAEDFEDLIAAGHGSPLLLSLVARKVAEGGVPADAIELDPRVIGSPDLGLDELVGQLDPAVRPVFASLGILRGTFDQATAAFVSSTDANVVRDTLGALARQSLVEVDRSSTPVRYRLHEVIRGHANEMLEQAGDAGTARRRLATYMASVTEQRAVGIKTSRERLSLAAHTEDLELNRLAWQLALEDGHEELASRIAIASFEPAFRGNHHRELARSIETLERVDEHALAPPVRVELLATAGLAFWTSDRAAEALATARRSLLVAEEEGLAPSFQALNAVIAAYIALRQPMEAYATLVDALREARVRDDAFFEVGVRSQVALAAAAVGLDEEAVKQASLAERAAAMSGSPSCSAVAFLARGVARSGQDQTGAASQLTMAVDIAEGVGGRVAFELVGILAGSGPCTQCAQELGGPRPPPSPPPALARARHHTLAERDDCVVGSPPRCQWI